MSLEGDALAASIQALRRKRLEVGSAGKHIIRLLLIKPPSLTHIQHLLYSWTVLGPTLQHVLFASFGSP